MKKRLLLLSLSLGLPVFAGSQTYVAPAPAPEPALWQWFVGASAGYLVDYEEAFYSAHVGVDAPGTVAGGKVSFFLEGAYTESNDEIDVGGGSIDVDREIIPMTFNLKFERPFTDKLSGYIGVGAGVASVECDVSQGGESLSDDDLVFTGQIFAGVVYNVTEKFEVFGGARWIYFDDADLFEAAGGGSFGIGDLNDDVLIEAGIRYNF